MTKLLLHPTRGLIFLIFLAAVGSPLLAQSEKNLLENGDFEQGDIGAFWDQTWLPGWPNGGNVDGLSLVEEPRTGSVGKLSVKLITTEVASGGGIYSALTPLDPQKPLKLTGWIKEEDISGLRPYIALSWYDKDKKPIIVRPDTVVNYVYIGPYERSTDWHKIEMNAPVYVDGDADTASMIPKNAAYFDVRLFVSNYIGTIWFDDFIATQP